jgi:hypothetical protein
MQYVPHVPHPARTLVVPLMAATLGAGVATATFAVVNIEDEASVSLPTPAVQSAPPSDAVAGQRNDSGPAEGAAQQIMTPAAAPATSPAARYDGGPDEGSSAGAIAQPSVASAASSAAVRYDGGPDEGASAGAISQPSAPSAEAEPFSGTRP